MKKNIEPKNYIGEEEFPENEVCIDTLFES